MATIISASRRTDIPAFYSEWFMNRIRAGYCKYQPPGNPVKTVSLALDDVLAFVFWSRNYGPMIEREYLQQLKEIGYDFFMHFTIVGYPPLLDPYVISLDKAAEQFRYLSDTFGKNTMSWRFDPIVVSSATTLDERVQTFRRLATLLGPYTGRCIISVMDLYGKTRRNMTKRGITCYDPVNNTGPVSWEDMKSALKKMAAIAKDMGIQLYTCCEQRIREDTELEIRQGHCIDQSWISEIIQDTQKRDMVLSLPKDSCQRGIHDCGCFKSVDIGVYDSCVHGCLYCYANKNKDLATKRYESHDPAGEMIVGSQDKQDVTTNSTETTDLTLDLISTRTHRRHRPKP